MKKSLSYTLLYVFVKVHALLPLRVLYLFSDVLYHLIYSVVKYRREVVGSNLRNAFPLLSAEDRLSIEREFYRNFSDYVMETIKLAHITDRELKHRAVLINPELIDGLQDDGHTCVMLLMGHCFNWEWFTGTGGSFKNSSVYQIYKPLSSRAFDRLFVGLRTRFGSYVLRNSDTMRKVISLKRSEERSTVIFIADQIPSIDSIYLWTDFMNQESGFFGGPERLAKKLDIPIVFANCRRPKRGMYEVKFELITKTPQQTADKWITEQYAKHLETLLRKDPSNWLWTHRRWKHTKQSVEAWKKQQ